MGHKSNERLHQDYASVKLGRSPSKTQKCREVFSAVSSPLLCTFIEGREPLLLVEGCCLNRSFLKKESGRSEEMTFVWKGGEGEEPLCKTTLRCYLEPSLPGRKRSDPSYSGPAQNDPWPPVPLCTGSNPAPLPPALALAPQGHGRSGPTPWRP